MTPSNGKGRETGRDIYTETVAAKYASKAAWADKTVERLRKWGFNTAGAWGRIPLFASCFPIEPILYLSASNWESGEVSEWFSSDWKTRVDRIVQEKVLPMKNNPRVVGWFLDTEIRWGIDWRGEESLMQLYLQMGPDAPGKAKAVDALLGAFGSRKALNAELGTDFPSRKAMLADTTFWQKADKDEVYGVLTRRMAEVNREIFDYLTKPGE